MAVDRWWRRTRTVAPAEPEGEDCPICVHINKWYGDLPVRKVTHGAGGPDFEWRSCWEHYKAVTAFEWLGWTGVYKTPSTT